ncbi:hypothetical protein BJX61DRAFT_524324, partial [Aspergillus egyptiacus]
KKRVRIVVLWMKRGSKVWEVLKEMLMGGRIEAGKDTVGTIGFINSRKHDSSSELKTG